MTFKMPTKNYYFFKILMLAQNSRNQGFSSFFCQSMEGSVPGSVQINYGSETRIPKNIRIRKSGYGSSKTLEAFSHELKGRVWPPHWSRCEKVCQFLCQKGRIRSWNRKDYSWSAWIRLHSPNIIFLLATPSRRRRQSRRWRRSWKRPTSCWRPSGRVADPWHFVVDPDPRINASD